MMNLQCEYYFKVSKTGLPLYQVGHQLFNIHLVGKGLISEGLHNGKPLLYKHVTTPRPRLYIEVGPTPLRDRLLLRSLHFLSRWLYIAYSRSIAFQFVHRVIRIEVCLSR